ncbi:helix-turn-helix domain-containing protein [Kaarinaea lacus]
MQTVPIVRLAHLIPYIKFLRGQGAPVDRELSRVKLPTHLPEEPGAYLPTLAVLAFVDNVSRSEGIDELGLRAATHLDVNDLDRNLLALLTGSLTLKTALYTFSRVVTMEDASVKLWLVREDATIRVCNKYLVESGSLGLRNAHWSQLLVILDVIRLFAGPNWRPQKMGFASNLPLNRYAQEQFPNTHLYTGQQYNWIEIPNHLLSLPPLLRFDTKMSHTNLSEDALETSLPAALQHLLKTYLHDSSLNIKMLADITGISMRSMQRRLSESGTSYSELLEKARVEKSIEMLGNQGAKIIDIAYSMGYNDPSHFSRAFRRLTGVSPRDYRKQLRLSA